MKRYRGAILALLALLPVCALGDAPPDPRAVYTARYDRWSAADERGYGEFIAAIGESGCATVNRCLHDPANPFRASDPPEARFDADCADLPYVLRFYYAWKRGLPFAYVREVEPRGRSRDMRYSRAGNRVVERVTVQTGDDAVRAVQTISDAISTATFRIHPDLEDPQDPDFYSPVLRPGSIRPGTMIYDPNGHVATVYRVEPDGRIHYIDAHPDHALTRGYYDQRFVRAWPAVGAGFKNWRPATLVGATRTKDGALSGGHVVLPRNAQIADFSVEQFFGDGPRPDDDGDWKSGVFTLNHETLDYYDYVRARLAGGKLEFDPLREVHDMVESNCADLHYRADAVTLALDAGLARQDEPARLPPNIYGTDGDWETYSTPSRDARLKTAFKELRDNVVRFLALYAANDPRLKYAGRNLPADMLAVYDRTAATCQIGYVRGDGSKTAFGYEEARRRLFAMSFDPYHCAERRWGAGDPRELATCRESALKRAWYAAEQTLRNQLERTYDARMGFSLADLSTHAPGTGPATAPDTDVRTYQWTMRGVTRGSRAAMN